jgi:hypothetical protein
LDAAIHHAKAAPEYGFGLACEVISETDAWAECGPVVIGEAFGNPIDAADADTVLVELEAS